MVQIVNGNHTRNREMFLAGHNNQTNVDTYAGKVLTFGSKNEMLDFLRRVGEQVRQTGQEFACYILVNQELAEGFIEINTNNRKLGADQVKAFTEQMESEADWKNTGDALCVVLPVTGGIQTANGQHRMWALLGCRTDRTYKFLVQVGGTPEDFALASDGGTPRTVGQRLHGLGYTTNRQDEAAIRMCALYPTNRSTVKAIPTKLKVWADKYLADVHKVKGWMSCLPTRHMRPAIIAAVVRAIPHVPEAKLKRFCYYLGDQSLVPDPGEEIIYNARIMAVEGITRKGSGQQRLRMYMRAQSAVHHFVYKTGVDILRAAENDLFPRVS